MTGSASPTTPAPPPRSPTGPADPATVGGRHSAATMALRDVAPLALALIPFSLAIGATIATSGLPAPAALAGSVLMMSGAAQLALIQLADAGAGLTLAVVTALLINARLVLYSAGFAGWFRELPRRRRLLLAIPLIDQTFLLAQRRFPEHRSVTWRQRYHLTATAVLVVCFVGSQLVGYAVGDGLPDGLGLHLAAPLAFAGLLGAGVKDRSGLVAAGAAATTVAVGGPWLGGLTIPAAALVGLVAAGAAGGRTSQPGGEAARSGDGAPVPEGVDR